MTNTRSHFAERNIRMDFLKLGERYNLRHLPPEKERK
jgi:hypothetical protein